MSKKDDILDLDIEDLDALDAKDELSEETGEIENPDDETCEEYDDDYDDEDDNKGKKGFNIFHIIFAAIAVLLIAGVVIMLVKWNKGTLSDYDPNADTSEFDTEANDYIQPLSSTEIDGKLHDGALTILAIGNSPFADDGDSNKLCKALAKELDATVINAAIPGSMIAQSSESLGECTADGVSLYQVAEALTTGDFNRVLGYGEAMGPEAYKSAELLRDMDMTKIDCIVIMYDLTDYLEKRYQVNDYDKDDIKTVYGSMNVSLRMLKEAFPYTRIVVMSTPACGLTSDGFYVDGDTVDLGCGKLTDYNGQVLSACVYNGVSFIDVYYGVINVDNRNEYIKDDYHINDKGAKAIAKRFASLITLSD